MSELDFDDQDWDDDLSLSGPSGSGAFSGREERTGDATGGVIPYKNPSALMAYYFGIFSIIPGLGLFLGVAAFILGIKGLSYAKKYPKVRGQVHAWIGIIAGGIGAILWGTCIGMMILGTLFHE